MKKIDLIYFNAGGGHRATAMALQTVIEKQNRNWDIRLINLVDILDPKKRFQSLTGMEPEDIYNKRLARGWTRSMGSELVLLQYLIKICRRYIVKRLRQYWLGAKPDMVVSLIPNFNRPMYEALKQAAPTALYMTVMTDFADLKRGHFWIERNLDMHMVCGTKKALEQAQALGYKPPCVHEMSGMVVRPVFYEQPNFDRSALMRQYGLNPELPTGVVLFGGHGSRAMLQIAKRLPNVQLIYLCGHNEKLATQLAAQPTQSPRLIQGFTTDVPTFMRMGDFLIGKPGPGCISEALACGLPPVLINASNTMPQERYNVQWVLEHKLGVAFKRYAEIEQAVLQILAQLNLYKKRVANIKNRALYEVPDIMAQVLDEQDK